MLIFVEMTVYFNHFEFWNPEKQPETRKSASSTLGGCPRHPFQNFGKMHVEFLPIWPCIAVILNSENRKSSQRRRKAQALRLEGARAILSKISEMCMLNFRAYDSVFRSFWILGFRKATRNGKFHVWIVKGAGARTYMKRRFLAKSNWASGAQRRNDKRHIKIFKEGGPRQNIAPITVHFGPFEFENRRKIAVNLKIAEAARDAEKRKLYA
jgi:hypothetical protein